MYSMIFKLDCNVCRVFFFKIVMCVYVVEYRNRKKKKLRNCEGLQTQTLTRTYDIFFEEDCFKFKRLVSAIVNVEFLKQILHSHDPYDT